MSQAALSRTSENVYSDRSYELSVQLHGKLHGTHKPHITCIKTCFSTEPYKQIATASCHEQSESKFTLIRHTWQGHGNTFQEQFFVQQKTKVTRVFFSWPFSHKHLEISSPRLHSGTVFQQLTNAKDYQRTYETQLACKLIQNNFLKKEFEQRYFTLLKHIYVRNLQQIKIIYKES